MKFGFIVASLHQHRAPVDTWDAVASTADRLGYDSLWMGHHVALASQADTPSPYASPRARVAEGNRFDLWTLFAHLAARTERLRFGTGVYLLPMVNPFVTARAVTTADVLSGGRIIFGIGVGWNEHEFALLGQDFHTRGARTDEIIDILKALWTQEAPVTFEGEHYRFGPLDFQPKPVQRPHPPMIYGGSSSERVLRRAARLDGVYVPPGTTLDALRELLARIRRHRDEAGLGDAPYDVTAVPIEPLDLDVVRRYEDAGVDRILFEVGVDPFGDGAAEVPPTSRGLTDNLERVADRLRVER